MVGNYDTRLATGNAFIFQTASLAPSYMIFGATQGVSGAFELVTTTGLPALFSATLSYSPTEVTMNVAANLGGTGNTPNQRAVGAAIDGYINTPTNGLLTTLPTALSSLYNLTAAQLPGALDALSGAGYASEQTVLIGDSLYSRQGVLARLRQGSYTGESGPMAGLAYGGPALAYAPPTTSRVPFPTQAQASAEPAFNGTVWAQGFGGWGRYGGADAADVRANTAGIISGADTRVGNWLVGAAVGYSWSNANIDALASTSDVNSLLVALYAGTRSGPWSLRLGATYAFNEIDASRTISFPGLFERAGADYDGRTAQVFAEAGYGFSIHKLAVEPFVGLAHVHVHTDGFTETGAAAGLTGASTSTGISYLSLGWRVATTTNLFGMVLEPHASVAWRHAFGDITPDAQLAFLSIPGQNFTVAGVPLAEDTALVEAGTQIRISEQVRIGVSYIGQFADGVTINAGQANLTWRF